MYQTAFDYYVRTFFLFLSLDFCHKSAGTEGFDFVPPGSGCNSFGRYEIALLCLGMMHVHFGHPKQALEVSFSFPPITNIQVSSLITRLEF